MKNVCNRAVAILMALVAFSLSSIAMPKGHFMALNASIPVLDSLPAVCLQTQSLNLLSFVRSGTGSFSGPGVSANTFNPTAAGAGRHVLTFQYYDSANQVSAVFRPSIWVYPVPVFVRFDNSCAPGSAVAEVSDLAIYSIDWYRNNQLLKEKPISYAENGDLLLSGLGGVNYDMCIDGFGNRYFSSGQDRVIRHSPGQQGYNIVAGGNGRGSNLDQLNESVGVAVDNAGNVFVADLSNNRIVRWSPGASTGVVVAGSINGTSGNGLTQLNRPYHIKFDNTGRLYVSDRDNNRIVSYPSSISTTNTPLMGTIVAGTSANIQLNGPNTLFIDSLTNMMYVVDNYSNTRIIQYNLSASNIANSGIVVAGGNGLGQGLNQLSSHIGGIYVSNGALFIADMNGERILYWRIGAEKGQVIAGSRGYGSQLNRVSRPTAVRIDNNGNLEYVDRDFSRLVRFSANSLKSDTLEFTEAGVYRAEFKRFGISCVSASADFTINKPIAQISSSTGATVCEGDTTTLSTPALAGYVYQWFKDGLQIAGAVASSLTAFEPGVYHVEVSDSNACSRTSKSMRIWPKPQATITADGLCLGSELRTNVPDSNVYQIDWFRNNQLFSSTIRKYAEYGEVIVGSGASQGSLSFSGGIGGFYAHTDGMLYIIDNDQRRIIRYDPKTQQHQTVAGGNGLGTSRTQFGSNISGVFVTFNGDVYVSDANNHRVMRWSPGATQGVIVAGSDSTSGTALNRLWNPQGIFVDAGGNLFIADQGNHRVVRWAPGATSGVLVAGGSQGAGLNQLSTPRSVFVTPEGILYVADWSNYRILRFSSGSTTGVLVAGGNGQGSGLNQLNSPSGLQVDRMGNIYVADQSYHRIVRWKPNSAGGELVVGDGQRGSDLNRVGGPLGVLLTPEMDLLVLNNNSQWGGIPNRITRFKLGELGLDSIAPTASGTYYAKFTTKQGCSNVSQSHVINAPEVALASSKGFDVCEDDTTQLSTIQNASYTYKWFRDGAQIAGATTNTLNAFTSGVYHVEVSDSLSCSKVSQSMRIWPKPQATITADGLCLGSELRTNVPDSNVYQIDWFRNNQLFSSTIRKYAEYGELVVGSSGTAMPSGLQFSDGIGAFYAHTDGMLYIYDNGQRRVVRYNPATQTHSTVAGGNGTGTARNQFGFTVRGIFVTPNGDVYVSDANNHRVMRWSPGATQGVIVAGSDSTSGLGLDRLSGPQGIFVDAAGNLFIADQLNNRVVRWVPGATSGVLVAGGTSGAELNQLNGPRAVYVGIDGMLYVVDQGNRRILRYATGNTTGVLVAGGNGGGSGLNQLSSPSAVFVDRLGNTYITDENNHRIVRWRPGGTTGELVVGDGQQGNELNRVGRALGISFSADLDLMVLSNTSIWGNPNRITRFKLGELGLDSIAPTASGTYYAKFTTKQGCSNVSQSHVINAPEVALASSKGFDVCEGDTTQLSTIQNASYAYKWFRDGVQLTGATTNTLSAFTPGIYHIEVLDSLSCSKVSQSMRIWPKPQATITADGLCLGSELKTNVPDSNVTQINWYRNDELIKVANRRFKDIKETLVGQGSSLAISSGITNIGDFFVRDDGNIYILDNALNRVVLFNEKLQTMSTVAGGNGSGSGLNQFGSNARGIFVTTQGDIYIADAANHRILKWTPGAAQGIVVAGATGVSSAGLNRLSNPFDIFLDYSGNLFISDQGNNRVVRWSPGATSGVVVAGGTQGSGLTQLNTPRGIFVTKEGVLYVVDAVNARVLRFQPGVNAGTVVAGGIGAGVGLNNLSSPIAVFVDEQENIYVSDESNGRITRWKVGSLFGQLVIGMDQNGGQYNSIGRASSFMLSSFYSLYVLNNFNSSTYASPNSIARIDLAVMPSDTFIPTLPGEYKFELITRQSCTIISDHRIISSPQVSVLAPRSSNLCEGDSVLLQTTFNANYTYQWFRDGISLAGETGNSIIAIDSGFYHVIVQDSNACSKSSDTVRIWPRPRPGLFTTGSCLGSIVNTNQPGSLSVKTQILHADTIFREVNINFSSEGTPIMGFIDGIWLGDLELGYSGIRGMHIAPNGDVYVLVNSNVSLGTGQRVVKYNNLSGGFETVATWLYSPMNATATGIFVTKNKDLYVVDGLQHRIIKWAEGATAGQVVIGAAGTGGSALDRLSNPRAVHVMDDGTMYILDSGNNRILRWRTGASQGEIVAGGNGAGAALNQLNNPGYFFLDEFNNLFVSDQGNNRVLKFALESNSATVVAGGNGQGIGLNQLNAPHGIYVDNLNNVFVSDHGNNRIVRWASGAAIGEVVAGLGNGNPHGLNRTLNPSAIQIDKDYNMYVVSVDSVNGVWPFNGNRIMRFLSQPLDADSFVAQYPGKYEAIFTNRYGCKSASSTLQIFDPEIEFTGQLKKCFSDGSFRLTNATPLGGVYTGIGVDSVGYFHPALAGVGNHKIYYFYQDSVGCSKLDSQFVEIFPDPIARIDTIGSMDLCRGESVTLQSPLVSGQAYQWYRNGVLIPQATQRSYTVRDSVSAQYHVMVTRNICVKSSDTLSVIVRPKPVVTIANAGTSTICQGDIAILQATSDSDVSYQWYRNNLLIADENGPTLSTGLAGSYHSVVFKSNGCGDTSNVLTIQVLPAAVATIDTIMGSLNMCRGESVTLQSPLVSGQNYQWYRNGVLIPQATQRSYTVRDSVSAQYHVMVTRNICVKSSDTLSVIVRPKPVVTIANAGTSTICQGDIAILQATSDSDVSYQWYRNNLLIADENGPTLSTGLAGSYHSVVFKSNGCGDTSNVLTIQVLPAAVATIDTIMGSLNMCRGESVTLQSPLVSGQNYQWYRNGVLIPQATQRSYTVRDSVSAQYHVMVTRNICEKSSDTLAVIVRPKPVVTIGNLGATTICQGDSVILQASSDTDVSYQWYRNGQLLAGSTQSSLVANQTGNYICQVVKANGCADTSNTLSLTVLDYPIAQITPVNATTVCSGQAVILNANQGTGLTHRWFRNGVLIAGATSASYQATQSGDYTVEVKRQQLCATVSAPVTVVVNPLPQIAIQVAQGGNFCSGDSIQINAQSTSQVLRYAWFRNGQLLPSDSTGTFFARLPGFYHARVFDTAGCDKASDSVQVGYFDPPFANENICAISVDTLTGRNVVVWEKTANVRTAAYNIYREGVVTGQYINIGRVPFDSMSTFTDTTANPLSQSFRYRIAVVDSCGFESARSVVHRTIHLSSNVGVNNEVNLFWTAYEGVPVPTHRIIRSVNGGPFVQIAQVSGTTFTYTDLTPPQGAKNYLIEIEIPGGCSPTGLRTSGQRVSTNFTSIRSNRVAVGQGVFVRNVGWNEPLLYPNPTSGKLYLKLGADLSDRQFEVYDARGRLVRRITVESSEETHEFDFSMEADGVYTIRSVNSEWKSRFVISK